MRPQSFAGWVKRKVQHVSHFSGASTPIYSSSILCTKNFFAKVVLKIDTKTTLSTDFATNTLTWLLLGNKTNKNKLLSSKQPFNTSNTSFQQKKTHSNSYLITIQNLHDNREAVVICWCVAKDVHDCSHLLYPVEAGDWRTHHLSGLWMVCSWRWQRGGQWS